MRAVLLCVLALAAGACFVDENANPDYCESTADCEAGEVCEENFCLSGPDAAVDAGESDGGVVDGGVDMGPPTCDTVQDLCSDTEECCGGECVRLGSGANCGSCGDTCGAGESCCQGECVNPASDPENLCDCPAGCDVATGEECCGGACVDVMGNDPNNCGGCGGASDTFVCAVGELCCAGECVVQGPERCGACDMACTPGDDCCSGSLGCQDLQSSLTSCGGCGIACAGGACIGGTCCGDDPGEMNCGGTCVNTNTSETHCGSCGDACDSGWTCLSGDCCENTCSRNSDCSLLGLGSVCSSGCCT